MLNDNLVERYLSAAAVLPQGLRAAAMSAPETLWRDAEEFRVRAGRELSVLTQTGEKSLGIKVTSGDVSEVVAAASRGSLHSVADALGAGFITAAGGHRVGVCGTAVLKGGEVAGLRDFSSVNVRISKEFRGVADAVYRRLSTVGGFPSVLILSPPGGGKTTLLRDLVRLVSDGGERVAIADERMEIAAMSGGMPGFDVGARTDVLEGAPKAFAALSLLRSMSPRVVALDEITDPADVAAVERLAGCGVSVIATAHAHGRDEFTRRAGERTLQLFDNIVYITIVNGVREVTIGEVAP